MPSPPPPYNFAVIPTVREPVPELGSGDRGAGRRGSHGGLVLDRGHETPASTVRDARLEEVLEMPADSPWPIVLAALVARRVRDAAGRARRDRRRRSSALALLALAAWHWQEPEERERRSRCPAPQPERLVGDGAVRRDRGDAVRDARRHLRLPAVAGGRRGRRPGCPSRRRCWPLVLTAGARRDDRAAARVARRGARGPRRAGAARARSSRSPCRPATSRAQLVLLAHDLDRFPPRAAARTRRSTSRCSARTRRTSRPGCCSSSGCSCAARGGLTRYRLVALQVTVFYWVFVNVLAVVVVAVQLSPRL